MELNKSFNIKDDITKRQNHNFTNNKFLKESNKTQNFLSKQYSKSTDNIQTVDNNNFNKINKLRMSSENSSNIEPTKSSEILRKTYI